MNPELDNLWQFSQLVRKVDGLGFRDLNKNGKLDVYEDPRQPIEARVADLLSQMTLEEKAGTLFINGSIVNADGSIDAPEAADSTGVFADIPPMVAKTQIQRHLMTHFNIWEIPGALALAKWSNELQRFAEETRLGIPVTIASDPRNHFSRSIYEMQAEDFSQWCQPLGLAAIGDETLVWQFANIARQEYLAAGIRVALHPQVDLATEPRWPRIAGTFGENAELSARLVKAYIKGFQGEGLGSASVACMTKHFPGGGPQMEGLDPHFEFQKGQVYPGHYFDYHLLPFEAAFEAGTAAIMPYYGVPLGQTNEDVAMGYNKAILTGLLREHYQYDGVICTDWGLVTDVVTPHFTWPARAWGVEHLTETERVLKILDAGADQFGGESCPQHVVTLVRQGLVSEERIDQSVRRLLRLKFQLGLFDQPFVDPEGAASVFGKQEFVAAGRSSQSRALTLLKNAENTLPLESSNRIFVKNMDAAVARSYAEVVATPEDADFALLRLSTPWVPVESANPMARGFHHGDLDFKGEEKAEILSLLQRVPTIVIIELDRPAVIPEISVAAAALLADYGADDRAV
ncbi:MAG: glycoside hydrolase family 3 N-terminal domain-containing protein, partial [Anaerolineae bacterium]|nr:glycoside hydrolase family 3 N-terminal domain-containing protein [Anaerolineae bacterium]